MSRGPVGIAALVAFVGIVGVVALGVAAGPVAAATPADNASLGADISSFMQASSVETAADVEEGRFGAAMNRTDDPDERRALVRARQARLEERSERLQAQRETLGETPDVRNRSVATRISVGAADLERSVNETERRARVVDVPTERLSELRESARAVRGPDVEGLARGIGGPPTAGPPDGTPPANRSETPDRHDGDRRIPESPGSPVETDAPTDARDADRGGPRDSGNSPPADESGSPNGDRSGNGSSNGGPPGGEPPDDGPPGAETAPAPGADRGNDDSVSGPNGPAADGENGPPTGAESPGNSGTDGRPSSPGAGEPLGNGER